MLAEIWTAEGRSGSVPKPLASVVDQMLASEPKQRPNLDAVKAALEDLYATLKA